MSHLKALKLTSAVPLRATTDPSQRTRERVIAALNEQKQFAETKIAGLPFAPTHIVRRKNAEGQRVEVETVKRVRQSWFADGIGKVFFALHYAGQTIEFGQNKNAIDVGDLAALPQIIDTLIEAIRGGELDVQLATTAASRRKVLRGTT